MTAALACYPLPGEQLVAAGGLCITLGGMVSRSPEPLEGRPDDALMERVADGDRGAFETLVRRHEARVFGLAVKYLGKRPLAEEACQNAFLTLWRNRSKYQARSQFTAYVSRLAINAARDVNRGHRRFARLAELLLGFGVDPTNVTPHDALEGGEKDARIEQALARLPEPIRETLVLRFYGDLSYAEIASALDILEATARTRVHHGLKLLRPRLRGVQ